METSVPIRRFPPLFLFWWQLEILDIPIAFIPNDISDQDSFRERISEMGTQIVIQCGREWIKGSGTLEFWNVVHQ